MDVVRVQVVVAEAGGGREEELRSLGLFETPKALLPSHWNTKGSEYGTGDRGVLRPTEGQSLATRLSSKKMLCRDWRPGPHGCGYPEAQTPGFFMKRGRDLGFKGRTSTTGPGECERGDVAWLAVGSRAHHQPICSGLGGLW